ncbi:hypothetical protein MBH78_03035 [Oceanimonas sp. NS1]|nr:hypothetical protein [Oceanimonas sp. NS1]
MDMVNNTRADYRQPAQADTVLDRYDPGYDPRWRPTPAGVSSTPHLLGCHCRHTAGG